MIKSSEFTNENNKVKTKSVMINITIFTYIHFIKEQLKGEVTPDQKNKK